MRNRTFRKLLFSVVFLVLLSSLSFGQGRGPQFRGGRHMMGPMPYPLDDLAKELNLTEEQTAKLKELRQNFLQDTLGWRNDLVVKRFDFQDLMRQPQADSKQILAKQREISELESKIQERMVLFQLEMRKVLTPEQIKLLPPAWDFPGYGGHRMMRGPGPPMKRE